MTFSTQLTRMFGHSYFTQAFLGDKIEQLVRCCVNKHLSTDRRLTLRIYRNFLGRKSSGQSKQLVPPCFGFVKHLFWCLNLR